jgi:hypothetical protein
MATSDRHTRLTAWTSSPRAFTTSSRDKIDQISYEHRTQAGPRRHTEEPHDREVHHDISPMTIHELDDISMANEWEGRDTVEE